MMKAVFGVIAAGAFCLALGGCANTPTPEQQYQVANPPRPRLDAKSELEDGARIRRRQQQQAQ